MKQYSKFVTLTGGILSFFCFALPWESNSSGLYLANGVSGIITIVFIVSLSIICINIYVITVRSNFYPVIITLALIIGLIGVYSSIVVFSRNIDVNINYVTIALFTSLVIIGVTIYRLHRRTSYRSVATLWVVISSIVGLCCFLVLVFGEYLNIVVNDVPIEDVKYGASLTAVGFILAIVGVLCFPSKENDSETHKVNDTEEFSVGEEE